jgi:cellulose synthase/poly-beta-1,6-N-acetylglucosamine synthase-like glycosyltransferase
MGASDTVAAPAARAWPLSSSNGRVEEVSLMILFLVIGGFLSALGILLFVPITLFGLECLAAVVRHRPAAMPDADACPSLVVLIPAHNEELGIEPTLASILPAPSPSPTIRVLVIADNCEDQTAALARRAGAEVLVRIDPNHRGKGYALQYGIARLKKDPPEVVLVLDADCLPRPGTIERLAHLAWKSQQPIQALNLTDRRAAEGSVQAVSVLGNRFTNLIRPLGLAALGLPCRLMGTGMAIPWRLLENVQLAGGSLVEDMQLGIDLALQGHSTRFCPEARVTSALPPASAALVSQQTRWDHGHLRTAITQIPRLLATALRRRSWRLLGLAFDLSIPPLTLLVALWLGAAILTGLTWCVAILWAPTAVFSSEITLLGAATTLLALEGVVLASAMVLGWVVYCRRQVPLRTFTAVPVYMLRKLPIYARLLFQRQRAWVRTERAATAAHLALHPHIAEGKKGALPVLGAEREKHGLQAADDLA